MICKECNREVRESDVKNHIEWGCGQEALFTFKPSGTFVTASAAPGTTYHLAPQSVSVSPNPTYNFQNSILINSKDRKEPLVRVDQGNITMEGLLIADQNVTFDELVRHTMGTRRYRLVRAILITIGLFACYGLYKAVTWWR